MTNERDHSYVPGTKSADDGNAPEIAMAEDPTSTVSDQVPQTKSYAEAAGARQPIRCQ
jgi:hypothetical protein